MTRTIAAVLLLSGLACGSANAGYSTWCNPRGKCWTHYFATPVPAAPAIQYVEPETAEEAAAKEVRVQKWEAICKPEKVTGADGIARYRYALPGCDTGRTE
jgi:hypothetical protein